MTLSWLALTLSLAVAPASPPPHAAGDPTAQARALFERAQKLYANKKYGEAVGLFEQAWSLHPSPALLYNVGRCREQLGEAAPALRAYRDYLRLAPTAADAERVRAVMDGLEKSLASRGVQQVLVLTAPESAVVEIDGRVLGTAPVSTELAPGPHRVAATAEGYARAEQVVTVALARSQDVTLSLSRAAPPPPPPPVLPTPPSDAPVASTLVPSPTPDPTMATAGPKGVARQRVFTWVATGVAGVALASAVAMGLGANGASAQMRDRQVRSASEVQALHDRAANLSTGANVAWGTAGVAAIAAGVLFVLEGR